jgi:selenophosphate synthetase-related protein
MLGCALTYAAALFAAVDGIADHLVRRVGEKDAATLHALRLKMGAKIAAAVIAVVTAAMVLAIDGNWIALTVFSAVFVAVVVWVAFVARQGSRKAPVARVGG